MSIAGLILYLWVYTEIDETVINIETQKQVSKELKNSLNELEIEISRLSRGDRISNFARKELGMIPAKPGSMPRAISESRRLVSASDVAFAMALLLFIKA